MFQETVTAMSTDSLREMNAVLQTKSSDGANSRPWRIAIKHQICGLTIIFDLLDTVTIGRTLSAQSAFQHIDLTPYQAQEMGVSRQHVALKLVDNRVYLMDTKSANGVHINSEVLTPEKMYLLHNEDRIKLGAMCIQVFFLMNPYECVQG